MLISLNWINDYVDLKNIPLKEKINRFLLSCAEVENVIEKGKDISGVVFAEITQVEPHPNSQKLHLLKVFDGSQHFQIVCGAPNVRVGMITALARQGAVLPNNFKIKKAKVAGVESYGMCCSESELGIGSGEDGIIDVKDKVELGQDIKEVFEIEDTLFEIDNKSLTHRPDLWGHYGIAREFAAIFSLPLKKPELYNTENVSKKQKLSLNIDDDNCIKYSAITADNITQKTSPQNMKIRLNYVGLRDINLLTDLTNYVMLDLGQPMHAFDNQIVKGIKVRSAKTDETMVTLEDKQHKLPKNSTVICNQNNQPVAIAGVMGGKLSGITEQTNSLLLESANFEATSIRKTSNTVGIRTDSSLRFEKTLDPNLTTLAIKRYLQLLTQIDSGANITSALTEVSTYTYPEIKIEIDLDFIKARTGISNLTVEDVNRILTSLEFETTKNGKQFIVTVPSFRATKDVSIKEDLVEEIARMYGYDNILPQSTFTEIDTPVNNQAHEYEYKCKTLLSAKYNFSEVHTYLWNYLDFNKQYGIQTESFVHLLDSSNSGQSGIRSKLLPSLLKVFHENKNNFDNVKIYEIGRVAIGLTKPENQAIEKRALAFIMASKSKNKEELYFEAKKVLEDFAKTVLSTKNIEIENLNQKAPSYFHVKNSAQVKVNDKVVGYFGVLNPLVNAKLDRQFNIVVAEIDFDELIENINVEEDVFKKISKYQHVDLDFNFKVASNLTYSNVQKVIKGFKSNLNFSYKLADIYKQDEFENYAYWTFSFNISHLERTLTSKDIDKFSQRLVSHMAENQIPLKV